MELGRDEEARSYTRRFLSLSTDPRAKLMFLRSIANFQYRLGGAGGERGALFRPSLHQRRAAAVRHARQLYASYPDERQSRLSLASALATIGDRREAMAASRGDP